MTSKLDAAIEELVADLQEQMNHVADTKRAINLLLRRTGKEPMFPDESSEVVAATKFRPDQFYGRPLATSVQDILEQRKQAMEVADILKALEDGAFDFTTQNWPEKHRLRMLSISLAKNTKVFHRLPNGLFGLLSWYPEVVNRKQDKEPVEQEGGENAAAKDKNKASAA